MTENAAPGKAYFVGRTLDDVMRDVHLEIDARGHRIHPRKGEADEIVGVLLEISDPRARLSRTETRGKIFSALGELCWYLAGSKKASFITYYIKAYEESAEDGEIFGAYGPRLFKWKGVNQIATVTAALERQDSRQAVIQLFDACDISEKHRDVPCTCTLQFLLRGGKLHLFANMRSNDAHWGLPHDVFCFTMLQEIMARTLSVELGVYKHAVGSLHRYRRHGAASRRFVKEGVQPSAPAMPPMPPGNPWPAVEFLREAEARIRCDKLFDDAKLEWIDPYWADLVRLLQVFRAKEARNLEAARAIRARIHWGVYSRLVDRVIRKLEASKPLRDG